MKSNELGIDFKIAGIGHLTLRKHTKTIHQMKSIAGSAFWLPFVISACVYDPKGTARLYLKKTATGTIREERSEEGVLI